jgi:hypothetical protein
MCHASEARHGWWLSDVVTTRYFVAEIEVGKFNVNRKIHDCNDRQLVPVYIAIDCRLSRRFAMIALRLS